MIPYRTPPPEWTPAQRGVAWQTGSFHARIGKCVATVEPEVPKGRRIAPYMRWKVTRDNHVTMSGTAMNVDAAKTACERAAEMLSESGWPTAFAQGGFVT